jgi:hypothetical protein
LDERHGQKAAAPTRTRQFPVFLFAHELIKW